MNTMSRTKRRTTLRKLGEDVSDSDNDLLDGSAESALTNEELSPRLDLDIYSQDYVRGSMAEYVDKIFFGHQTSRNKGPVHLDLLRREQNALALLDKAKIRWRTKQHIHDKAFETCDQLQNIDALLSPGEHADTLKSLEARVMKKCSLGELFESNEDLEMGTVAFKRPRRSVIRQIIYDLVDALQCMQREGFCSDRISVILRRAPTVRRTVEIVDVQIEKVIQLATDLRHWGPMFFDHIYRGGHGDESLAYLQRRFGMTRSWNVLEDLSVVCAALALGIASYVTSHCGSIYWLDSSSQLGPITPSSQT